MYIQCNIQLIRVYLLCTHTDTYQHDHTFADASK